MELVRSPENWLCISGSVFARYICLFVYQMIEHISFQTGTLERNVLWVESRGTLC